MRNDHDITEPGENIILIMYLSVLLYFFTHVYLQTRQTNLPSGKIQFFCIVLYCIVLYCIVLYCIVLYCIVLYCIVLYCIVLYCIVVYCIVTSIH